MNPVFNHQHHAPIRWQSPLLLNIMGYLWCTPLLLLLSRTSSPYAVAGLAIVASLLAALGQGLACKLQLASGQSLNQHLRAYLPRPLFSIYGFLSEAATLIVMVMALWASGWGFSVLTGLSLIPSTLLCAALTAIALWFMPRKAPFLRYPLFLLTGWILGYIAAKWLPSQDHSGLILAPLLDFADHHAMIIAALLLGCTLMPSLLSSSSLQSVPVDRAALRACFWPHLLVGALVLSLLAIVLIWLATLAHSALIPPQANLVSFGLSQWAAGMLALMLWLIGISHIVLAQWTTGLPRQRQKKCANSLCWRQGLLISATLAGLLWRVSVAQGMMLLSLLMLIHTLVRVIPLLRFCADPSIMGSQRNGLVSQAMARVMVIILLAANAYVLICILSIDS